MKRTWALRDRPAVLWLVLAFVVAIAHPWIPHAHWLLVHVVLLGALTHAAMVWSTHFTQALLKNPPTLDVRRTQSLRVGLLLGGTSIVLIGVPIGWWPLTVSGATLVSIALGWHGIQLWRRLRHAMPSRFRISVHYYVIAAGCLPVGAVFGALLARELPAHWHARLLLAHTMTMVLGWIGLTVTGTLITLWPTMLRTRMDERAVRLATRALPALLTTLSLTVVGAVAGSRAAAAAGLVGYLSALLWWERALWRPARQRPPQHFATLSVSAALAWWLIAILTTTWTVASADSWSEVSHSYDPIAIMVAVGFGFQLLTGALSYLVPSVVGGGPAAVRAGQTWFDRWSIIRLSIINAGLMIFLLPTPATVRWGCAVIVGIAMATFVPLLFAGLRASIRTRLQLLDTLAHNENHRPRLTDGDGQSSVWSMGQLIAACSVLTLVVVGAVTLNPTSLRFSASTQETVTPTGEVTRINVQAKDMRYTPASVTVPRGNRLIIELVNTDTAISHDLVLATGPATPRLAPGERATLDAGIISATIDGWCSVAGHRQMGMVFAISVAGSNAAAAADSPRGIGHHEMKPSPGMPNAGTTLDLHQPPNQDFQSVPALLPKLGTSRMHQVRLEVKEVELEVAPGVWQKRWTFGGRAPGPVLHGRVGDVFDVTLVNDGSIGHSIDFHAGALAPDRPMRTIAPGETLEYRFTATRAGTWMYHCATMPMSAHIAAGMHGAVIIEPPDLPTVDTSYVLVQSEVYLGENTGRTTASEIDVEAVTEERPDAVVFNGIANQYNHRPLTAAPGKRVRFWLLNAGPNRGSAFHIVGGQFDTVYREGAWLLRNGAGPAGFGSSGGSQAIDLAPAQGGFVELAFPEAGRYPMVSHVMVDAERGAHGFIDVR